MDENNLDLNLDEGQKEANRTEQRLRQLNSEKAKLAADKVEADAKTEAALKEAETARKDADFYKNFSTVNSKYAGANEYQDKIREKVNLGYTLEDATVSVLNSEGKFIPPSAPQAPRQSPTGGSANTILPTGDKTVANMTQAERRAALVELEKRGDLGQT